MMNKKILEAREALFLGNYAKAENLLEDAADTGDAQAMFELGQMYLQGRIHPGDERQEDQYIGWDLIEDAAYNGHALAQFNMGYHYLKVAEGPSYELDEAERFFIMAEDNGYHIPTGIKEEVWKLRNVQLKDCSPETLSEIISAYKYGHDNYWYVCKALQESGIGYKDLKALADKGNVDALVLSYIGLSTTYRLYSIEEYVDEDDDSCVLPVLSHGGAACHKAIFNEPEEELDAVRKKLMETLYSLDTPQTNIYMLVFKDSADLDILFIFANLGYPEAKEELEFRLSLQ